MTTVELSLACWGYDRTRALQDGSVRPVGIDLTYLELPVEATFFRMMRNREFDVAEMSLSSYVAHATRAAEPDLVAIPVFPSRLFRHSGIYVRQDSPITDPAELAGRIVGIPEYQLTAVVWIRGILQEHHGLDFRSVRYRTGGMHTPGRREKQAVDPPAGVQLEAIPGDRTLVEMLLSGEIDALYAPRTPQPMLDGTGTVRHLFPDPRGAEEEYARKTGIFPVMHTVVLRRAVYERHRWAARSLYDAFTTAKQIAERRMADAVASPYLLPWVADELARARELLGPDFWPYGVQANHATLSTFLDYAVEQGIAPYRPDVEDLFVPETHEDHVI